MPSSPIQLNKLENSAAGRAMAAVGNLSATLTQFTDFTADLVHDVFKVVVDSTMEQLEAYADLVAKVSGSLAQYEDRMLGNATTQKQKALDYINQIIIKEFCPSTQAPLTMADVDSASATLLFDPPKVTALRTLMAGVQATIKVSELPNDSAAKKDDPSYEKPVSPTGEALVQFDEALRTIATPEEWSIVVPHLHAFALAKLKKDVKASYDRLVVLLKLGLQKVVVTDGEISTSLTFHTDSTDSDEFNTSNVESEVDTRSRGFTVALGAAGNRRRSGPLGQSIINRSLGGSISGSGGMSRVRSKLKVNVVNEKKVAITNLSVDITGRVMLRFRTDFFPLIDVNAPTGP